MKRKRGADSSRRTDARMVMKDGTNTDTNTALRTYPARADHVNMVTSFEGRRMVNQIHESICRKCGEEFHTQQMKEVHLDLVHEIYD